MAAKDILAIGGAEVGTKATNYKVCKYNTWYYGKKVSGVNYHWCAIFVRWCFYKAALLALLPLDTANCGVLARGFKDKGQLVYNKNFAPLKASQIKPRDVVFFHWSNEESTYCPGVYTCDHVGIVKSVNSDGTITTIEGNTGSTSNGEVMERVRSLSVVSCVGRPKYDDDINKKDPSDAYPNVFYRVRAGGTWLKEVNNDSSYAGTIGKEITDIAIKVSEGKVKYRVHIKGGKWLPYVSGYNINNDEKGYAGDKKPIDAIEIIYTNPVSAKTKLSAKYRVSPVGGNYYDYQYDNKVDKKKDMDGYAGLFGKTIDRVQITLSK